MIYDVIIIGGGPAGVTAAIYAKRAGKSVLVIEKELIGGKLHYINSIENYPGYPKISGMYLSNIMLKQLKLLDVDIVYNTVTNINVSEKIKGVYANFTKYECKSLIICIGLTDKKHKNVFGENVSHCELCDGYLSQGKSVAVIGGGNSAFEAALYLSNICDTVSIIIRLEPRAENILVEQAESKKNIKIYRYTEAKKYENSKLFLSNGKEIECKYVFVKIGGELGVSWGKELQKEKGFFNKRTGVEGVFVAGDCVNKEIKQIVTAISDGAKSAILACEYLTKI